MAKGESLFAKYPDYEIALVQNENRVCVSFGGEVIADSEKTLLVRETKHAEVIYFPREDVRFEHLIRTEYSSFCPFKGQASYWSLRAGGHESENAVWSYEDPFAEVAGLTGYVAFYADRVDWS